MGAKLTFYESTKLIIPDGPPDSDNRITIDAKVDLYSDGKEDWATDGELRKFKFPIEAIGGQVLSAGTLKPVFVLSEGWHFRPYEGDHEFIIDGYVYTDDGSELVQDVVGSYKVTVRAPDIPADPLTVSAATLNDTQATQLANILKSITNKETLDSDGNYILYDDDGATPLYTRTITDKDDATITLDTGTPARRTAAS